MEATSYLCSPSVYINSDLGYRLLHDPTLNLPLYCQSPSRSKMDQFKGQPRLPKFAVPKRYDISLKPNLVACRFSGSVAVDLDIVASTTYIVLNAAELSISNDAVSFTSRDSSKVSSPPLLSSFFLFMGQIIINEREKVAMNANCHRS